ncbi:MAG TPA: adenylyl-sulfate kinase [Chitinophagales bacterium]|nr:adenylyl-sulfate kinase [Chitinophagales bacterium]
MNSKSEHIHPFNQLLPRESKEQLLGQHGLVLWFTGLSGSGKSTIAKGVEEQLHRDGYFAVVLDGDNVRTGINNNLGFSDEDRKENIRRIAEVAKLFVANGVVVICSFVSPTAEIREQARNIIGDADFREVFINTPIEECERRDVKGLYAKARNGEIKDFTGISAPFEAPVSPALEVLTQSKTIEQSVNEVVAFALPIINHQ